VKITDVRVLRHERPLATAVGPPVQRLDLLTLATDEGLEGHTFLGGPGEDLAEAVLRTVRPMLIGTDPLDIGRT